MLCMSLYIIINKNRNTVSFNLWKERQKYCGSNFFLSTRKRGKRSGLTGTDVSSADSSTNTLYEMCIRMAFPVLPTKARMDNRSVTAQGSSHKCTLTIKNLINEQIRVK